MFYVQRVIGIAFLLTFLYTSVTMKFCLVRKLLQIKRKLHLANANLELIPKLHSEFVSLNLVLHSILMYT